MRSDFKQKLLSLAMAAVLAILCGCTAPIATPAPTAAPDTPNATVSPTPAPTPEQDPTLTPSAQTDPSPEAPQGRAVFGLEERFFPLPQLFVSDAQVDESKQAMEKGEGLLYSGTFLYNEKEEVAFSLTAKDDDYTSVLRIGEAEMETYHFMPLGCKVMDMIPGDGRMELAYLDSGPSADPTVILFSYDGTAIRPLGELGGISFDFDDILTDGKGRFLSPFSMVTFTEPILASHITDLSGPAAQEKELPEDYLGKPFTLTADLNAYFDAQPSFDAQYDPLAKYYQNMPSVEGMRTFPKGAQITILHSGMPTWYYVDVEGETGYLCFWVGD